jgi:hypothetical protein
MTPATVVRNSSLFVITLVFMYLTYCNPDFFIQFSSIVVAVAVLLVAYFVARQIILSYKYDEVVRQKTTK